MTPVKVSDRAHILTNISVILVIEQQNKEEEKLLLGRISMTRPTSGTQKLHTFLPDRNHVSLMGIFLALLESAKYSIARDLKGSLHLKDISGLVTCVCDSSWWLGHVPSVDENTK
jgi:hypothetical protein